MSTGERQPLLQDVEKVRASAPPTANGHHVLQRIGFVHVNVPWFMAVSTTMKWMLNVFTVIGSFLFTRAYWQLFTPRCLDYGGDDAATRVMCHVSGFCFWTFPLLCALIVLITFWRQLYESRLYYECLLHRVMISYRNTAALENPLTWVFIIYGCLATSVFLFVESHPWDPFVTSGVKQGMIIYLSPLVSFFMVFLSVWQVEAELLPLPKFYETDPDLAKQLLSESVVANDVHLHVAFEDVEDTLDAKAPDVQLTSAEYFGLLAEAVKVEMALAKQAAKDLPKSRSCMDDLSSQLNVERIEEYGQNLPVTRPEVFGWRYRLQKRNWWVHRLLHSPHFEDDRSKSFRFWGLIYIVISVIAMLSISEVFVGVGRDWFKTQRQLDEPKSVTLAASTLHGLR